jgi:hypothetical protein
MTTGLPTMARSDDGHPVWIHQCRPDHVSVAVLPLGAAGWEWTEDGGLTPSFLCRECGTHGFWRGGPEPHWEPC